MKRKIGSALQVLFGMMIVLTAIIAYRNSHRLYQLTFLSNFTCAVVLLTDGILGLFSKKRVPIIIYQMLIVVTNVVFCTCFLTALGIHRFNFSGAFFFLHAINPIVFLLLYLYTVKLEIRSRKDYMIRIFLSPALVMSYLLFDFIRYCITGYLVYGLISPRYLTVFSVPLIGIGFYFLMAFMAYGMQEWKLAVQKKTSESKQSV